MTQPVDQTSRGRGSESNQQARGNGRRRTNLRSVIGGTEDELRCAVVPRADVADVRLARDKNLGGAKVTELEDAGGRVKEEVLGLDVAVANLKFRIQ